MKMRVHKMVTSVIFKYSCPSEFISIQGNFFFQKALSIPLFNQFEQKTGATVPLNKKIMETVLVLGTVTGK